MMVQTLIWDNDGVLVDTEGLYYESCRRILAGAGCTLRREDFVRISLQEGRSVFALLGDRDREEVERLRDARNVLYSELLDAGVRVCDGVRALMEELHGRVRMGVVTGSRRDHFERMHVQTGLRRFLDFELTHDEYERSKPDPEPYRLAVERFALDPATTLVVEDSERGVLAATRAGLRCVAIPNDLTRGGDFSPAYRVLTDVHALRNVIAER